MKTVRKTLAFLLLLCLALALLPLQAYAETDGDLVKDSFGDFIKWAASLPLNLASPINAGALLMILSIVIVPVVSLFTKPCEKETVDNAFAALEK